MRFFITIAYLFLAMPLFARAGISEQKITNLDTVVSLDSEPSGTDWYGNTGAIDPATFSAKILNSKMPFSLDANWNPVKVPDRIINSKDFKDYKGMEAWYAKAIWIAENPVEQQISLRLGEINDRDRAYFNGRLIGETGNWNSADPQAYDRHRIYSIPPAAFQPGLNLILVHVKGYTPGDWGIYRNTTAIGPTQDLLREYYISNFQQAILLAAYGSAGAYFLFLFLRRRKDRENLFFALFVFGLIAYQLLRTQLKYLSGLEFFTLKRIEYVLLFALMPIFYYFIRSNFRQVSSNAPKFWKAMDRIMLLPLGLHIMALLVVLFVHDAQTWNVINTGVIQPSWGFFVFGIFAVLIARLRRKDPDAIFVALAFLVILVCSMIDTASSRGFINLPRVMVYGFISFIFGLATVLANRFVRLNQQVEDLNKNLEKKVRTHELQNTLNQVQDLKTQQDGDYFLTSLLVEPLNGNYARSNNVFCEILLRQKKKFVFKKWRAELGGDFISTYTIKLRNRSFTAFINGDAMGKSIQGAGGALVLGVVYKAAINRLISPGSYWKMSPEQWLRNMFLELQSIFVNFDGSMMVSVVMGLVDDETGTLYYINAEHPWVVLYRKAIASFIENELLLRKIGVSFLAGILEVKVFQLEPDDVIIVGSDGRDDILIGVDARGNRIINENEYDFLRRVEDGRGDLLSVEQAILKHGKLTDDLSLIRIGFKEDFPLAERNLTFEQCFGQALVHLEAGRASEALQKLEEALQAGENPAVLPHIARAYEALGRTLEAAEYYHRSVQAFPARDDYLELAGRLQLQMAAHQADDVKARLLRRSLDNFERLSFRHPRNRQFLDQIKELYVRLEMTDRIVLLEKRLEELEKYEKSRMKTLS